MKRSRSKEERLALTGLKQKLHPTTQISPNGLISESPHDIFDSLERATLDGKGRTLSQIYQLTESTEQNN